MDLHELQRKLKGFDVHEEVHAAIVDTQDEIVRLNQGQLFLGIRSDGTRMDDYSPGYVNFKSKLSHPIASITDRRTLFLTGAWWRDMKVEISTESVLVGNSNFKTAQIIAREGAAVLGLSKESRESEYIPLYFGPALAKRIELGTGLKMLGE
jgi:hypothetical protein